MGGDIPLDKAELIATVLEGILYGFSLLMFGGTVWVLITRRSTQKVNRSVLVVACALLLCSTVHLIIDFIRIIDGLILQRNTFPGGPRAYFASVSNWTFVSKNYAYAIQTLLGDGVILYRCYVVWQSKWVMILPGMLWCTSAITGFACPLAEWQLASDSIFSTILARWIKAFYGTAFTTNVLTTCLLVFRIWYIDLKTVTLRGHSRSHLRDILHTIIDAGVIYCFALLAWMICYSLQSNGQYVIVSMLVPIISITFYMVIVRVGLMNNRDNRKSVIQSNCDSNTHSLSASPGNRMRVHITTIYEQKTDDDPYSHKLPAVTPDDESGFGWSMMEEHV